MIGKTAVVAITKHGIVIARKIKDSLPESEIYAPIKHSDSGPDINWFDNKQTTQVVANLFKNYDALICIFSLGAVIRIIAPFLVDKKTDPAVLVIDDKANFVISTLSGHLGGANALTRLIASYLNSKPVITTAADVNETIPVDIVGKNFGWIIENYQNVTKVSAFMVNEEKIGLYQEAGEKNWWDATSFPQNVNVTKEIYELKSPDFRGALIISDKIIADPVILEKSVIYRPKSLVVGIGLHRDTSKEVIENGIQTVLKDKGLSFKSIRNISSINKEGKIKGLQEFSEQYKIPVEIYDKGKLGQVSVPNPSKTVQKFEGIPSVSEASSILSSNSGELIVPKQKFPPNLTVAVSRVKFD